MGCETWQFQSNCCDSTGCDGTSGHPVRSTGQHQADTDLGAALELLLGIDEHLNIQEEPETVIHRAEAMALRGGTEAPPVAVLGAQCLRWGTVSLGAVVTVTRRVIMDTAGGL